MTSTSRVTGIMGFYCKLFKSSNMNRTGILLRECLNMNISIHGPSSGNKFRTFTTKCCRNIHAFRSPTYSSTDSVFLNTKNHVLKSVCTRNLFVCRSKVYQSVTCIQNISFSHQCRHYTSGTDSDSKTHQVKPAKAAIPSLSLKRQRKKVSDAVEKTGLREVIAYPTAKEYDLTSLKAALNTQGLYLISNLPFDMTDVIHVTSKYPIDQEMREIFFLQEGSVVFWEVPERERDEVLKFVKKHHIEDYETDIVYREHDRLEFKVTQNNSNMVKGVINIAEPNRDDQVILEKYSFSHALSQSVQLAIAEASLEDLEDKIEDIVEDLMYGKTVKLSRREIIQKLGKFFQLRHIINLKADLLDTPDFYWDRANLETLYQKCCSHLNLSRRTRVMNEKLNYCCELLELVKDQQNDRHHIKLELMIIALILIEVLFEVLRLFLKD